MVLGFGVAMTVLREKISRVNRWLSVLQDGCDGRPHTLSAGEGKACLDVAMLLGFELVSHSKIRQRKRRLKRGQRPRVFIYMTAPISKHIGLYEVSQTKPCD